VYLERPMKLALAVLAMVLLAACSHRVEAVCELPANLEHLPELPSFGRLQLERERCNRLSDTLLAAQHVLAKSPPAGRRVKVYGELARRLYSFGFHEQAIELFRGAWSLAPTDFRSPFMLSLLEQERGGVEALELAEAAFELKPEHPPLQAFLARLRFLEGDLEGGSALARQAVAADPGLAHASWTLAEIAASRGDSEAVLRHASEALEAAPEADFLYGLRATALTELGRQGEAGAARRLAGPQPPELTGPWITTLTSVPFKPLADTNFGLRAMRRGQYVVAVEALERAHANDPSDPRVLLGLGRCRRLLGDTHDAVRDLQVAVELDSRYETWIELARSLQEGEQTEAASAAYRQALEHRPEDKMARFWLAECLALKGESQSALTLVEQLLDEGFGPSGYLLAAQIASRLERPGPAREFLLAGIRKFPSDGDLAAALLETDGAS